MTQVLPLSDDSCRVPIASAFNLRDFGGCATADGGHVKRGMLYRCGTMSLLTHADAQQLRALGIRAICDFRRPSERAAEPTTWHGEDVDYYAREYSSASGVLGEITRSESASAQAMRDAMIALYNDIATEHAESYRAMFGQILAGRVPILINCAAGKDRTGVGAALILAALGVSRDTIAQDYLRTNVHADWDWRLARSEGRLAQAHRERAEIVAPVLSADIAYLDALYAALDESHGGLEGYLETELGIDPAARSALRATLLEP
ncbi:MAG: tyrosine-protein phosphatase [Sphingobium sp.]